MTLGKKIALIAAGAAILGAGTVAFAPQASAGGLTIVLPLGNDDHHYDRDRYYHRDFRHDDYRHDGDRRFDDQRFSDRHDGDRGNRDHDGGRNFHDQDGWGDRH